ncbi:MAG: hypothetical protein JWM12_4208 [Ilumatobacteraceae bacterium]|nr:hypothetical protein [Ilumatobacteraceae bacterium]
MTDRTERLVGAIDLRSAKGLELGPLTSPVVTRAMGDIRYLDHVGTDALRARYASHEGFDVEAIVDIDYAIEGASIRGAVGDDAPFDYVIASHVIEHVPDLIGWLDDLRRVVHDDSVVQLAIPDHRRTFDALRSPTVTADVIQANLDGATAPSPRQVFDHYSSAVSWRGAISWGEEPPFEELVAVHSEAEAYERATAAGRSGDYDDVHCWVFTPRSFCRVFAALQRLQLVPFAVAACTETVGGEFFVSLRPAPVASATTPSFGGGSPRAAEAAIVRSELVAVDAERATLRADVAAMSSSRSWRITRPIRTANVFLARRRAARRGRSVR